MKKLLVFMTLITSLLILTGCPGVEGKARDTAAALKGALESAQAEYTTECQADPSKTACTAINRGVAAQNALVTATEGYCGWATTAPPPDPSTKCVPVASAKAALDSAIANANQAITEIKGVLKK